MKKIIFIVVLVLCFISLKLSMFRKTSMVEVPELLASSRSKEFCSCYFLLGNSEQYCLEQVLKGYPLFDHKIKANSVTFSNPFYSSISKVSEDKRYGCYFVE